jgi:peptidoglycan/xylan/chitin deacetylase (PgdA/CDA1 family)
MTHTRAVGSDNPYARWSPIVARPPLRWPDGAALAVCVIVSVEHLEWLPAADAVPPADALSYGPYPRAFQLTGVSRPEYGGRVGAFRLLEALDRHGVVPTVAMDAARMDERRRLVEEFLARGAEFLGHGVALSRTISQGMGREREREEISSALAMVQDATGQRPAGWLGPGYAESTRTVGLLAELGLSYVCDWPNDEQPYLLDGGVRELVAVPVAVDLDDVMAQRVRRLAPARWQQMVLAALACLVRDGATGSGRVLVLNLHAHVSGQPFRIRAVEAVLAALASTEGVWLTTTGQVADAYRRAAAER